MALRRGSLTQTGVALAAATAKTVLQLVAPANQDLDLQGISLGFHGTSNSEEGTLVELYVQTDAGTSTALTPAKLDLGWAGTLQSTARHTATVEPTTTTRLRAWTVHPQHGLIWLPLSRGEIVVYGGTRVGLRMTTGSGITASVDAEMVFEE